MEEYIKSILNNINTNIICNSLLCVKLKKLSYFVKYKSPIRLNNDVYMIGYFTHNNINLISDFNLKYDNKLYDEKYNIITTLNL